MIPCPKGHSLKVGFLPLNSLPPQGRVSSQKNQGPTSKGREEKNFFQVLSALFLWKGSPPPPPLLDFRRGQYKRRKKSSIGDSKPRIKSFRVFFSPKGGKNFTRNAARENCHRPIFLFSATICQDIMSLLARQKSARRRKIERCPPKIYGTVAKSSFAASVSFAPPCLVPKDPSFHLWSTSDPWERHPPPVGTKCVRQWP